MSQQKEKASDFYKYVTAKKATHMFEQIEKELDTSLETCSILDEKLYKLINISIVAITGLFAVFQFSVSHINYLNYKLLISFGISNFIMIFAFIRVIYFSCKGLKTKGYKMRNHKPESFMLKGCIDQEYKFFIYSLCIGMKSSIKNNYEQNDMKSNHIDIAINILFYGFIVSIVIFLLVYLILLCV